MISPADILLWPDGYWMTREHFDLDREEEPRGARQNQPSTVIEKDSPEWVRLRAVRELDEKVARGPKLWFLPCNGDQLPKSRPETEPLPDSVIDYFETTAREAIRLKAKSSALQLTDELRRATKTRTICSAAQKVRAAAAVPVLLAAIDAVGNYSDHQMRWRSQFEDDPAKAIAWLERISSGDAFEHAQTLLVRLKRKLEGRSLANMRPIITMGLNTGTHLMDERAHCRLVMKAAKKEGDSDAERTAAEQLFRVGVALTMCWDKKLWSMHNRDNRAEGIRVADHFRRLIQTLGEVRFDTHGWPASFDPGNGLEHLSANDSRNFGRIFGSSGESFVPFQAVLDGADWSDI